MSELFQIIRTFPGTEVEFSQEDTIADFSKRPGEGKELYIPEVQWEKLAEIYGLSGWQTEWLEKVINLTNPEALEEDGPLNLNVNWATSYDIRATQNGFLESDAFYSLAAIGVTITKDKQVVVGIRGGEITPERVETLAVGLYGLAPGGSVLFKPEYDHNPLVDTLIEEFRDEVGPFDIISNQLIGVFNAERPGPKGVKFVAAMHTDATLEQIQRLNRQANILYNTITGSGGTREDALEALKDSKFFPVDAWEHTSFIGVENSKQSIANIVNTMPQAFSGIGAGALMTYAETLKK